MNTYIELNIQSGLTHPDNTANQSKPWGHRDQGHVQAHTGAQRFATVSVLNDMFPGNGVQRGLRYFLFICIVYYIFFFFSIVWWVCQKCQPNQQQHAYL